MKEIRKYTLIYISNSNQTFVQLNTNICTFRLPEFRWNNYESGYVHIPEEISRALFILDVLNLLTLLWIWRICFVYIRFYFCSSRLLYGLEWAVKIFLLLNVLCPLKFPNMLTSKSRILIALIRFLLFLWQILFFCYSFENKVVRKCCLFPTEQQWFTTRIRCDAVILLLLIGFAFRFSR